MILNIRIDHKTADINKIEESTRNMDEIFANIQHDHQVQEYVQVKTCNRAEIYMVLDEAPYIISGED
ncbi:hypothetical protein [Methanobacterium petrolearium]|uniref:hypothetical protein n=1 Tax=Methanobacterium petrolearium TaxID=710190 RepID=UPI003183F573|nr:hypothetical protein GCM10025861_08950 [Methanobacterium petrolearium]